jgi:hypothetical protein
LADAALVEEVEPVDWALYEPPDAREDEPDPDPEREPELFAFAFTVAVEDAAAAAALGALAYSDAEV